ncbi:MAG: TIGR02147 family protein [Bacteriovoracaceae bacterium]
MKTIQSEKKKNPIDHKKTDSLPIHIVILREELNRRMRLNGSYSLRSFAKQLDLDPSLLSKILQNTRSLSPVNVVKILERLKLGAEEKNLFWQSYVAMREVSFGKIDPYANVCSEKKTGEGALLDQDIFNLIAEPHHYALVELTRLKNFQSDPEWISNILGISVTEVESAIGRLLTVGLIKKEGEKIVRAPGRHTTKDKSVTAPAFKYHQRKVLEQAMRALDNVALERRNQSSMTIAINPQKIPLAKKMIQDFVDQLSNVLETGELEEVYQMSFSLFPLMSPVQNEKNDETREFVQ